MNPRLLGLLVLRWVALAAMTVWLGGFTFYSVVVIPILHDELGGLDSGMITGQVSNYLNAFGVAAVAAWWALAACERSKGGRRAGWLRAALLCVTTAVLAGLIALHPVLDARLDSGEMSGFYPLHQVYLIASSVQWGVNLALLAVTVWVWRPERGR